MDGLALTLIFLFVLFLMLGSSVWIGVSLLAVAWGIAALVGLFWLTAKLVDVKAGLLAAGEALLAADMWHATGALVGGILIECGGGLISLVMLRPEFEKAERPHPPKPPPNRADPAD